MTHPFFAFCRAGYRAVASRLSSSLARLGKWGAESGASLPAWGRNAFGRFHWERPEWLPQSGAWLRGHPRAVGGSLLGLILILAGAGWGWAWWSHLPQAPQTTWLIGDLPALPLSNTFDAEPLTVTFDKSVARLDLIGKDVKEGVHLSPALPGTWNWLSDTQLVFTPKVDWPPATQFTLSVHRRILAPQIRLDAWSRTFTTLPLTLTIDDSLLYIDPDHPERKQLTAKLTFSHAVDRRSLEHEVTLGLLGSEPIFGANPGKLVTFTYRMQDRVVDARSANLTLPAESITARLSVPTSVRAAQNGAYLSTAQQQDILVPTQQDLFHFSGTQALIVNNQAEEPEQSLVLSATVGAKPEEVANALHVYILPQKNADHPDDNSYAWSSPAEVTPEILAKSTLLNTTLTPSEMEYATAISFKIKAPENRFLYVKIDQGLASIGSGHLTQDYAAVVAVPSYPREVHIQGDGSLLALNGDRKLTIASRGVQQLEYRLSRITPGEINHLVSQSDGNFQSPVFNNDNFDESDLAELIVRHDDVATGDNSSRNYSALDFSEFLGGSANDGKLGLFILHVMAKKTGDGGGYYTAKGDILTQEQLNQTRNGADEVTDPIKHDELLTDRRLILLTDLGLLVKDNADKTHDIFVQSIKTGRPVSGAQVQVLGKNGLSVVTVETDDGGHAVLPALDDFEREKRPVAYVVTRGSDVSFLPFGREDRELNLSRFDTSGVTGLAPHDLTAFVFTDRGIYRPGDEAKFGIIVKQRDWQGKLEGVPLQLEIVNPASNIVQTTVKKLNAQGFMEDRFPSQETSLTGEYTANLYLVKTKDDKDLLGSTTLKIREFLPDRMKIASKLSSSSEGWVNQKGLQAFLTLEDLYGAPAAGNRVTGKLTLNPSSFSFDKYPDYTFIDPNLDPKAERKVREIDLPDQTTDEKGAATFNLDQSDLVSDAYQLSFLAEAFEKAGGRSVTASNEVLVSPRDWLLGVKPDGSYEYITNGSARTARLLAVDPHLHPIRVDQLTLKLEEIRFVSVLSQGANGNYAYQSVEKDIPVEQETLTVPAGELDWKLRTDQPGEFLATVYDEHDTCVAKIRYTVAGSGNLARPLEKNAELTAKLSQAEYHGGDDLAVQIDAPYTGSGLITIERDKVYAYQWFKADTTSSVQHIKLPDDFEGNGYLCVTFVRGLDSPEIYMSPLSYVVVPFKVNQEARHTHLTISAPPVARPGQTLSFSVTASRPTQAIVYGVDEGILRVAGYQLPDPLAYFFRKQALEVGTRQTLDLILPEYSIEKMLASTGGDEGADLLAHHLNPFKRKTDLPVAFWTGIVELGPQANTFTYPVPDYFAGSVRLMVVAATEDAVGSAQAVTQVRGPFVIQPNVPTFVAPGDTFTVSVDVANNVTGSGTNAPVALKMETTPGVSIVQAPAAVTTIPEGKDTSVSWQLKAGDALGNADLTVTAEMGPGSIMGADYRSHLVSHLSVRPPVPYLTRVTSGYFTGSTQQVPITRQLYPEYREGTALASTIPQGLTRGLSLYLEHYEYGCTEQLISKAFPSLIESGSQTQGISHAEAAQKVAEICGVMATRQNDQGAIGLWDVTPNLDFDFVSILSMHFLTEARERGFDVPSDLFTRGMGHLQQIAGENPTDPDDALAQAYSIYLLTRNSTVTTNDLEHNRSWFEQNQHEGWQVNLANAFNGTSYAILKNQSQADALIGKFEFRGDKDQYDYDFYDDLGVDSLYLDLIAHHFPERLSTITSAQLLALTKPIMDGEYTTVSAGLAVLALDDFAHASAQGGAFAVAGIQQVTPQGTGPLKLTGTAYQQGPFDPNATALIFQRPENSKVKGLFYQITESGFEKNPVTQAVSDGLEIYRQYRNPQGQAVDSVKLGDEVNVVLRVRGTGDRTISNVAILDLLPGGFEVVPESVHTGTCAFDQINYADVREDRVAFFGDLDGSMTEITYKIKATNAGIYTVPPPQAEAMYHLKIRARGTTGSLTVTE